jgi:hypothetical protein
MKKPLELEVVWVPRDYKVQHLIDQYLNRDSIDYLMLTSQFRKLGWSTAGLFEVVQHQERQRQEAARADGRDVDEVVGTLSEETVDLAGAARPGPGLFTENKSSEVNGPSNNSLRSR